MFSLTDSLSRACKLMESMRDKNIVTYEVDDIRDPNVVQEKAVELFREYERRKDQCFQTIQSLEGRITAIETTRDELKPDGFFVKAARLARSVGIVALFILGIATVIPAAVAVGFALNAEDFTDTKIFQIAHKYITLKSQEQVRLMDQWEEMNKESRGLLFPNLRGKIVQINSNESIDLHLYQSIPEEDRIRAITERADAQRDFITRMSSIREKLKSSLF